MEGSVPFRGFYAASKFPLKGFAEALRYEVARFGIRVSVIAPAAVRTPAGGLPSGRVSCTLGLTIVATPPPVLDSNQLAPKKSNRC
jgi:NAD(P)-dependent dehydrogenase (short-subunit alcohol dehydrogenase family)